MGVLLKGFFNKLVVCHLCTVQGHLFLPKYLHPSPWRQILQVTEGETNVEKEIKFQFKYYVARCF